MKSVSGLPMEERQTRGGHTATVHLAGSDAMLRGLRDMLLAAGIDRLVGDLESVVLGVAIEGLVRDLESGSLFAGVDGLVGGLETMLLARIDGLMRELDSSALATRPVGPPRVLGRPHTRVVRVRVVPAIGVSDDDIVPLFVVEHLP